MICDLNADVYGFMELENTTPSDTITDLLGAVNARCGGAHPYTFVNTGGTLGTDAIRVAADLPHRRSCRRSARRWSTSTRSTTGRRRRRPSTSSTRRNPAFGQRFTVIANHFKSKGCPGTGGGRRRG